MLSNYFLLTITSICWASWGYALKFTKNYKQSLFYLDYTIFALIISVFIWLWAGGNFKIFANPYILVPILGGILFAFGNLILIRSMDKYGFSFAYPSIVGSSIIIGGILNFLKTPKNNPLMFFPGLISIYLAVKINSRLYPSGKKSSKTKLLDFALGALFIGVFPLFWNFGNEMFTVPELFLTLMIGHLIGILLAAFLIKYLSIKDLILYKNTSNFNHLISLVGATVWVLGTYLNMTIGSRVGFGVSFLIGNTAPLFASFWGIFFWKEIDINKGNNWGYFGSMALLFLIGVILVGQS